MKCSNLVHVPEEQMEQIGVAIHGLDSSEMAMQQFIAL